MATHDPTPTFILLFDGACNGNPGSMACSAIAYREGEQKKWKEFRKLGCGTYSAAEYYGLIIGLRRLLHEYRITKFNLKVESDSDLIVRQMNDDGGGRVLTPQLQAYHNVAVGLVKKIRGRVEFIKISRDDNREADQLASESLNAKWKDGEYLVFNPSVMNFIDVECAGRTLVAGHDSDTATPTSEILIDANTLKDIFGTEALENATILGDPGRTSFVRGKADFTILGVLAVPLTFNLRLNGKSIEVTASDVIVIDFLPYDIQVSFDHVDVKRALAGQDYGKVFEGERFNVSGVPAKFRNHAFWQKKGTFFAASAWNSDGF